MDICSQREEDEEKEGEKEENEKEENEKEENEKEEGEKEEGGEVERGGEEIVQKGPVSKKKLKIMLGMLCEEAQFLVDQSSRDQMKYAPDDRVKVLEADSILKALSIENETDVERLLGYFFETTTDEDEDSDAEDNSAKDPLAVLRRTCKVRSGDVVVTVRKFVADRAEKQSDDGAMQVQAASMAEKVAANTDRELKASP